MSDCIRHDSVQFSLHTGLFGHTVVKMRESEPIGSPGDWGWGRWKRLNPIARLTVGQMMSSLNAAIREKQSGISTQSVTDPKNSVTGRVRHAE
jgi:hypothetical protein